MRLQVTGLAVLGLGYLWCLVLATTCVYAMPTSLHAKPLRVMKRLVPNPRMAPMSLVCSTANWRNRRHAQQNVTSAEH
ncbi:hypothetical protein C8Q74DRAFT_1225827 [Fomes fomentarius]|nr:hypothetical protein C8Q74DRAFT_1225827 [Fomes fomentarius]